MRAERRANWLVSSFRGLRSLILCQSLLPNLAGEIEVGDVVGLSLCIAAVKAIGAGGPEEIGSGGGGDFSAVDAAAVVLVTEQPLKFLQRHVGFVVVGVVERVNRIGRGTGRW